MLSPDDRALYSECLEAPLDYRFDCGIATTFTLNLETLLVLPFTLATNRAEDVTALLEDPVALLESLRSTADRLTVFHQAGYIHVPPREQLLFGLLEDCVVPVAPAEGIFHPKVWVLRFVHVDDGSPWLRVVVLSHNLTFDRCWDTVLCLEGEPGRRRVQDSDGLRDFVSGLESLAAAPLPEGRRQQLEQLSDECAKTAFAPPEPFRPPLRFHSIGPGAPFRPELDGYAKRVLCVSPFLSKGALVRARRDGEDYEVDHVLISRGAELDRLSKAVEDWECHVIADAVELGDSADEAPPEDPLGTRVPTRGLHAKVVAIEDHQRRVAWWIGSANLTTPAWVGKNVELMVELHGTQKHAGIDRFLQSGFERLLAPWIPSEPDPERQKHEAVLARAEEVRDELLRSELHLRCVEMDDSWRLTLEGLQQLPDEISGHAWPITLAEAKGACALDGLVEWGPLAAASLTAVIAFSLTAEVDGVKATLRFALQLPHDPFPADRHAHIVRQIIGSKRGFFRYLRILLAAASGELETLGLREILRGEDAGDGAPAPRTPLEEVVLEDLVRALSRQPERLDAVKRVVDDLTQTEEGRRMIPEEFLELWTVIDEARERR